MSHAIFANDGTRVGLPTICFEAYSMDSRGVNFEYSVEGVLPHRLHSRVSLPIGNAVETIRHQLAAGVVGLGIALMSYIYVAFPGARMLIRCASIADEDLLYWKDLFEEGLREHFFIHNINLPEHVDITCDSNKELHPATSLLLESPRVLVPLGLGKDSTLLFEIIKKAGVEAQWCALEEFHGEFTSSWRTRDLARVSGAPDVLIATHENGLSGPLEAVKLVGNIRDYVLYPVLYAFTAAILAVAHNFNYIAVGNERSANDPHLFYQNRPINHQHEKSFRFECATANYFRRSIRSDLFYFSGLMPFWEIQIVASFSCIPKYLNIFLSCNQPIGDRWCANCPKCALISSLFSAFVSPNQVRGIFGDDLLERPDLVDIFGELLGKSGRKPLECVPGPEEVQLALYLARKRFYKEYRPLVFRVHESLVSAGKKHINMLSDFGNEYNWPDWFKPFGQYIKNDADNFLETKVTDFLFSGDDEQEEIECVAKKN